MASCQKKEMHESKKVWRLNNNKEQYTHYTYRPFMVGVCVCVCMSVCVRDRFKSRANVRRERESGVEKYEKHGSIHLHRAKGEE